MIIASLPPRPGASGDAGLRERVEALADAYDARAGQGFHGTDVAFEMTLWAKEQKELLK